ncbi:MAG: hypothetical protein KDB53_12015 [Planctomycetes bacterium]|nr:hypothetical protein [Planctomycetota bacterium]
MAKYSFWILLAACVMASAAIYSVNVNGRLKSLEQTSRDLVAQSAAAEVKSRTGVGPAMLETLQARQTAAHKDLADVKERFRLQDQDHLDHWFAALDIPWGASPDLEEFARQYALASDRLGRELLGNLAAKGVKEVSIPLIAKPWIGGSEKLTKKLAIEAQREFWVQDRLLRAVTRLGAVPLRPIRGGEASDEVGRGAAGGYFDRLRFDLVVHSPAAVVHDLLHAFDGPFDVTHEDGTVETMALLVNVDNVSIKRLTLDSSAANRFRGEPPVEVAFYLTVLDYRPEKAK